MDEQEIIAILRAHVARNQDNGSNGHAAAGSSVPAVRVDASQLNHFSAELWRLRNGVGQLNPRAGGLLNRFVQEFKKFLRRSLSWYTRSLNEYHDTVNQTIEYHARALSSLQEQVSQLGGGLPEVLQETLRSARRATQEQLAPYAQLFRDRSPVLDLGCGRGEFLELLKAEGVSAYGIDSDPLACEEARRNLLKVVEGDLFECLHQVSDRSLGGIFSSRLIEYLPAHRQPEMISLSAAKLRSGGLLVIETINPDSEFSFGRTSHIDPTHHRAIYPEALKSMVESDSFENCSICVLAPQELSLEGGTAFGAHQQPQDNHGSARRGLSRAAAYAAIARRR